MIIKLFHKGDSCFCNKPPVICIGAAALPIILREPQSGNADDVAKLARGALVDVVLCNFGRFLEIAGQQSLVKLLPARALDRYREAS